MYGIEYESESGVRSYEVREGAGTGNPRSIRPLRRVPALSDFL